MTSKCWPSAVLIVLHMDDCGTSISIDGGRHERDGLGEAFRRIGRRRKGVPQRGLVLDDDAVPGSIVAVSPQGKAALPVVKRHVLLRKIKALHRGAPYSL